MKLFFPCKLIIPKAQKFFVIQIEIWEPDANPISDYQLFFSFAVDFQRQHGFYAHIHPKSVVQKKCVLVLMYQLIAATVTCRFACAKNLLWIPHKKYTCRSDDISCYFLDKEDTPSTGKTCNNQLSRVNNEYFGLSKPVW